MRPVLKHIADGEEHQLSKLIPAICDNFGLTPEQRALKIPSGQSTYVYGRIGWAKTYLAQANTLMFNSIIMFAMVAMAQV